MNRQAYRSDAHAANPNVNVSRNMPGTNQANRMYSDSDGMSVTTLAEDGKEIVQRSYDYVSRTVRDNPTLALAGVVAVGALAALVFMPRRNGPRAIAHDLQRDLVKHTRDLRKAVRQELRDSNTVSSMSEFSKVLSNIDWKPYIQPIVDQANSIAQQASSKLSGK